MKLVKLNGEVHVRGADEFVKMTRKNVVEALRAKMSDEHRFLTKEELLSRCSFDENGELVSVR